MHLAINQIYNRLVSLILKVFYSIAWKVNIEALSVSLISISLYFWKRLAQVFMIEIDYLEPCLCIFLASYVNII